MSFEYRIFGLVLLLALSFGVCMQYATTDHWSYPGGSDIVSEPQKYDGEKTLLFGEVQAIDDTDGELVVLVPSDSVFEVTVTDVPATVIDEVRVGESMIQVYGTLQGGPNVMRADEIVVDFRHTGDRLYTYGTSLLGGILAIAYFLWHWRPELRTLRFVPRGDQ